MEEQENNGQDENIEKIGNDEKMMANKKNKKLPFSSLKNATVDALRKAWNSIPFLMKIQILGIITLVILIIVLVIFGTIIMKKTFNDGRDTVTNYVSKNIELGNIKDENKEQFEIRQSILGLSLTQINEIYEENLNNQENEYSRKEDFSVLRGSNIVTEKTSRIVSPNDKLPILQHILLTEKYNFNAIKWMEFGHGNEEGKETTIMKEDKELGLKYPDDSGVVSNPESATTLTEHIELVAPFIQTWNIPMAFYSYNLSGKSGGKDSVNIDFAYSILNHAMSDIEIGRYDVESLALKTQYTETLTTNCTLKYEVKVDGHNNVSKKLIQETINSQTYSNSRTNGNININDNIDTYDADANTRDLKQVLSKYEPENISPRLETEVGRTTTADPQYFMLRAKTFDMKFKNEIEYKMYKESDVNNRVNFKSINVEQGTINNNYVDLDIPDLSGYSDGDIIEITTDYISTRTNTVTRNYNDEVSIKNLEKSTYEYEDLVEYNTESEFIGSKKIAEDKFLQKESDKKYYKDNEKLLNRVMFINANPNIFNEYILRDNNISENIGYYKENFNPAMSALQMLFKEIENNNGGVLPFAYGATLGFNVYINSVNPMYFNMFTIPPGGLAWPVKDSYNIDRGYSVIAPKHEGIQIGAITGDEKILAAHEGTVIHVSNNVTQGNSQSGDRDTENYGNYVVIENANKNMKTVYSHMKGGSITVNVGDTVKKNDELGIIGNTGNINSENLYYEIHVKDADGAYTVVDPLKYYITDTLTGKQKYAISKTYILACADDAVAFSKYERNKETWDKLKYERYFNTTDVDIDWEPLFMSYIADKIGFSTEVGITGDKTYYDSIETWKDNVIIGEVGENAKIDKGDYVFFKLPDSSSNLLGIVTKKDTDKVDILYPYVDNEGKNKITTITGIATTGTPLTSDLNGSTQAVITGYIDIMYPTVNPFGGGSAAMERMISEAIENVGTMAYCQDNRNAYTIAPGQPYSGFADCSSFVYAMYKAYLNIEVGPMDGSNAPTGTTIYKKSELSQEEINAGWTLERIPFFQNSNNLVVGDILHRIGKHVALYAGEGKVVEVSTGCIIKNCLGNHPLDEPQYNSIGTNWDNIIRYTNIYGSGNSKLVKYIHHFEGTGVDPVGNQYVAYTGDGYTTIGYGVTFEHNTGRFANYGITSLKSGDKVSKSIVDKIEEEEIKAWSGRIDSYLRNNNITLQQHQLDALYSFAYNAGNVCAQLDFARVYNETLGMTQQNQKDNLWNKFFSKIIKGNENGELKVLSGLVRRRASELELFMTGNYEQNGNGNPYYENNKNG